MIEALVGWSVLKALNERLEDLNTNLNVFFFIFKLNQKKIIIINIEASIFIIFIIF